MCGIAGLIKRKNLVKETEKKEIDEMLSLIYHRGPDDTGACGICENEFENKKQAIDIRNNVKGILGFNRLSIQDLTSAGHQPMLSEDKNAVITFNGEIYNVDEIKEQLRKDGCNMSFRGHSDTEVILRCYSMYGIDKTLQLLNGMFAIVIADIRKRTIYIARDRVGIIPCHIMIEDTRIVWASEIKAFLALSGFKREVNDSALSDAIKFCYSNSSMYKNVANVDPGTYLIYNWKNDSVKEICYFSFLNYGNQKRRIDKYECETVLKDCLCRQLISDAPLGVQLSGGVDSTLLAKYVSDIYSNNGVPLHGFSLINNAFTNYSEEKWIDHAAQHLNINVHKYDFNDEVFVTNFEKALYSFERFVNNPSPVGIYKFSTEARNNVTVLISGEGADELAGGYDRFALAKLFGIVDKIFLHGTTSKYGKYYPQTINNDFVTNYDSMLSDECCRLIYESFSIDETIQTRKDYIGSLSGSAFEKMRLMYFKEELVSLLERQNKVCMSNSVENRVPFLDNKFVELLFTTNEDQLVHPLFTNLLKNGIKSNLYEGKYILKQINSDIYGKQFAFRKKQALRIPLSTYITNSRFKQYLNEFIIPGMRKRGMVNMKQFESAYSNLKDKTRCLMAWKAINFEAWMQLFYDGRNVIEI